MAKFNLKAELKKGEKFWKESKETYTELGSILPEGTYNAKHVKSEIDKIGESLCLKREFVIMEGEYKGKAYLDTMFFFAKSDKGTNYRQAMLRKFFVAMGINEAENSKNPSDIEVFVNKVNKVLDLLELASKPNTWNNKTRNQFFVNKILEDVNKKIDDAIEEELPFDDDDNETPELPFDVEIDDSDKKLRKRVVTFVAAEELDIEFSTGTKTSEIVAEIETVVPSGFNRKEIGKAGVNVLAEIGLSHLVK